MTTRAGDPPVTGRTTPATTTTDAAAPRIRVIRWFVLVWLVMLIVLLATHPGRMVFETKLAVDIGPSGFLKGLWHLWNPLQGFGSLDDQAVGYGVPMAPFYLAGQLTHVPVWVTERLWISLIVAVGFTGVVRLARALGIGSSAAQILAGLVFALWPAFTTVIGSTSAATLPGMLAPWAVLPLVAATRDRDPRWRRAVGPAVMSGVVVLCMGGVNATSTLDVLLLPGLFIVTHARGRCLLRLSVCWAVAVIMATAWWSLPLLLQGKYSFNFLPYIEQASTTTSTASANAVLRGAGDWIAYLNVGSPSLSAGWAVVTLQIVIAGSAIAAAGGLYGLAMRSMPESAWLRLSAGIAAAVALAGYGGPLGGPFHRVVQDLLNGTLAPFRNIYKFEPVIALALALGLAHATAEWLRKDTSHDPVREAVVVSVRFLAVVVLVGLAAPYLTGQILTPGSFTAVPRYWSQVATFLADQSPRNPALVVPADGSGQYLWGYPDDDPLDALARSPIVERVQQPYAAGSQVLLSTAETAVESGEQVNGLAAYLGRAGIRYVVVRNDLNPRMSGYVPPVIVHQTLALSGFARVAAFGPLITGAQTAPQATAAARAALPSYPAVEVYAPAGTASGRSLSPVAVLPVSQTVLVNGGPDSLLQLVGQNLLGAGQPAVIAGDPLPATPAQWDVTDGQRRADELFGQVNGNLSYTYTATETNPADFQLGAAGEPPRQLLPVPAAGHQTVAVLSGAAQVTVSSYGSWLGETQQENPANAFDGDPATAWTEGSRNTPAGQWIQIAFDQPADLPASIGIRLLDDVPDREIASQLRVSTAAGSTLTSVAATGATQSLRVVPGRTSWLRVTFAAARRVALGAPGAGISDVLIPGIRVTSLLKPAEDPAGQRAPAVSFSFDQQVPSPVTDASPAAVPAMARTFTVPGPVSLRLEASALALPGTGLDSLLGNGTIGAPGKGVVQVSTGSAAGLPAQFPASLIRGTGSKPWIADSASPVIQLSWDGKRRISSMVVQPAYGVASTPETVKISSQNGTRVAPIGFGGVVTFSRPLIASRISVSFPDVQLDTTAGPTGQVGAVPLGLYRLYVPALANLRPVLPDQTATFRLACGDGPALTIDGQAYQTTVSGTIGALSQFRPLQVRLCTQDSSLPMSAGQHTLVAAQGTFALTGLSLSDAPAPAAQAGSRAVTISSWQPDNRRLTVGPGESAYLEIHENYDTGWTATLDGHPLTPVRLDGWQQGFVVPSGAGGTITLTFGPARIYHLGLLVSLAAVLLLLIVAAWLVVRRFRRSSSQQPPLARGEPPGVGVVAWWIGVLGVGALVFVAGGAVALAVPVLAGLAYWRPRWLPVLAFAGMIASGLLAAIAMLPSGTSTLGPFSAPAQLTALVALAAAILPAASWAGRGGRRDRNLAPDGSR